MNRTWWREYAGLLIALALTLFLALACALKGHAQTFEDAVAETILTHQHMAAAGLHRTTSNEVSITVLGTDAEGRLYDSGRRINASATAYWVEEPEVVSISPSALYQHPLPHWRVKVFAYVNGAGPDYIDVYDLSGPLVRCWHRRGHLYPPYGSLIIVEGHVPSAGRVKVSSIIFPVQD